MMLRRQETHAGMKISCKHMFSYRGDVKTKWSLLSFSNIYEKSRERCKTYVKSFMSGHYQVSCKLESIFSNFDASMSSRRPKFHVGSHVKGLSNIVDFGGQLPGGGGYFTLGKTGMCASFG